MSKKLIGIITILVVTCSVAFASDSEHPSWRNPEFFKTFNCECLPNVENDWTSEEQKYVDMLWDETLLYLDAYIDSLTTGTEKCRHSAEATIQTYNPETGQKETRCIMKYRDVQLLVKHVQAVLENPDKAKKCFSPERNVGWKYTPSTELYDISPVAKWMNRPLLTDYYQDMGGEMGRHGMEFAENFQEIVSKTDSSYHFKGDITIKGLPNLWAASGWVPMYSKGKRWTAGTPRFRGGYAYAEVMGPWGLLKIKSINGETVGAEIGMTAQLFNTTYPFHFHNPQEIYQTLSVPECADQYQNCLLHWDNPELDIIKETGTHYMVEVNKADEERWKKWFVNTDPKKEWLLYLERDAIHAFNAKGSCVDSVENSGLVTVWARTTAQDYNYSRGGTTICRLKNKDKPVKEINSPDANVVCKTRKWQY